MSADIDALLALEPEALRCPHESFDRLRDDAPVVWLERIGCFAVTRYDDILRVLRSPELFSSASATGPASATPLATSIMEGLAESEELRQLVSQRASVGMSPVLLTADPPLHSRQRNLVNRAFTLPAVAAMEPGVRQVAVDLVDGFVDAGEVEFVSRFCVGLPLTVIADALGVPRADLPAFKRWSDQFVVAIGNPSLTTDGLIEMFRNMNEFYDYFTERIRERQRDPRDDLLSAVVSARLDGSEPLSEQEMLGMLSQFLVAGNETTTKMLASGMLRLATEPDLQDRLRADPSLLNTFVDEILRLDSPVQGLFRTAVEDTEIGGVPIPKGSHLWVLYASGNRDAAQYPDPQRLDVERSNSRTHLAFGQGAHYCLGAPLARAEGRIGFEVLLDRLDDIRLVEGRNRFEYEPTFVLHGLKELHVAFDRR